jgi:hypothetical protein
MRHWVPWAIIGALCFSCGGDGTDGAPGVGGKGGKGGSDAGEAGLGDAGSAASSAGRGSTGGKGGKGGTGGTSGDSAAASGRDGTGGDGASGDAGTGGRGGAGGTGTGGDIAAAGAGDGGGSDGGTSGGSSVSPTVAVLWPAPGLALNASVLGARAMVAGVDVSEDTSFRFNGATIDGANVGNVSAVRFAIDGSVVAERTVEACPQPFVEVDLALDALAPGEHVLTVTSVGGKNESTSVPFTLDPTLAAQAPSFVERALTPGNIECLTIDPPASAQVAVGSAPLAAEPAVVAGSLVLPPSSSWDPTSEGLFVALAGTSGGIPPEAWVCADGTCTFNGQAGPFTSGSVTSDGSGRRFLFSLQAASFSGGEAPLVLRTGDDWGGVNLGTLERQGEFRVAPSATPPTATTIGPGGGVLALSISQLQAAYLEVPPGALTKNTAISLTPVTDTTLAGTSVEIGVTLEPAGLVFAVPARLTLQFGEVREPRGIMLWTSPTSAIPLLQEDTGRVDLLTGYIRHFTSASASPPPASYFDQLHYTVSYALGLPGDLSLDDIGNLLAVVTVLQSWGEDDGLDLVALAAKVQTSLLNYVVNHCPLDIETPTEGAAAYYYTIAMVAQGLGADVTEAVNCADEIRRALCDTSCGAGEQCYAPGGVLPGTCCKAAHCGDGAYASEPECGVRSETDNCGVPLDCGECAATDDCFGNYQCRPKPCNSPTGAAIAAYAAPHPPCGIWDLRWQDSEGVNWCARVPLHVRRGDLPLRRRLPLHRRALLRRGELPVLSA